MDATLYTAAAKGDIEVLRGYKDQLLDKVTYPTRNTVLHVIAQYNDSADAIVEILSNHHSSMHYSFLTQKNSDGETALYIASRNRREFIVGQLLTSAQAASPDLEVGDGASFVERMVRMPNKNGDTPLHEAVNNKDTVIVELLLKADPNYEHLPNNMGKTPLYLALEKRMIDAGHIIERCFYHVFNLESDVCSHDPTLEAILKFSKSPGIQGPHGETVLHAAARRRETTKWIIEICKHIPNITKKQDDQGFTPLHYAAYFNNFEAIGHLLDDDKSVAYITAAEVQHYSMTPLHIAASQGHQQAIESILDKCGDCWDALTSKGQNILHLAAEGQYTESVRYIVRQPWAINLVNMKDDNGNTPSHLLLSSMPKNYETIKYLLEHPNVHADAFNKNNFSPVEMLEKAEIQFSAKKVFILNKLQKKFGRVEKIPWMIDDGVNGNSKKELNKTQRLAEMKKTAETHLLVAALIATVTFAAGFTLPGGYDGNDGPNQGMAVLIRKSAFKVFAVTDTVAVISSCIAIFLHFTATLYKYDEEKISRRYSAALLFLVIAMISMAITFVAGLYVVLAESPAIAITVCIIGCVGILYLIYLIRKVYRDMGVLADEYFLAMILLLVPSIFLFIVVISVIIFDLARDIFIKVGHNAHLILIRSGAVKPNLLAYNTLP